MLDFKLFVYVALIVPAVIAVLCVLFAEVSHIIVVLFKLRIASKFIRIIDIVSSVFIYSSITLAVVVGILFISYIGNLIWSFITI